MPNYKFHTATNLILAPPLAYYGYMLPVPVTLEYVATATVFYIVATFFLSPDLDLAHSRATRNWGILRPIWWGYHKSFKHRGLSHSLFLSSLSRIAYLVLVFSILFVVGHLVIDRVNGAEWREALELGESRALSIARESYSKLIDHREYLIAAAVGIFISDAIHILSDRVFSLTKVTARRFGKG